MVFLINFFLYHFDEIFFLGVNCDQEFLGLLVSLSFSDYQLLFLSGRTVPIHEGKDGLYIAHIPHMDIGLVLVLLNLVVHQYMVKIIFFQKYIYFFI